MAVSIGAPTAAELPDVLALLERCDLPREGLADHVATLLVAREEGAIVGSAALEIYGRYALLRSVAVDAPVRGHGLGQRLTAAALDLARQRGLATVYLLTETAGQFFPRFGFRLIPRASVAPAVQQSPEFATLCPVSALAMALDLGNASA